MINNLHKVIFLILLGSLNPIINTQQVKADSDQWQVHECQSDTDADNNSVIVCDDGQSIGVFWNDGSYVNGYCDSQSYEVDYEGLSKRSAISWVNYFCDY